MAASAHPCICSSRAKVKARHYPSRCRRLNTGFLPPVFRPQGEKRKQMSRRDRRSNKATDRRDGAGWSGAGSNGKPATSLSGDGCASERLPLPQPGYSEGTAQPAHGTVITESCFHPKGPETGPGGLGAGTATSLSHHSFCAGRLTREGPPPLMRRAVSPEFCWRGPLSPQPLKPGDQTSAGPECP